MEKHDPLLPLWYVQSRAEDDIALNSAPRDRQTRDENAGGTRFHTRGTGSALVARKRVHDQEEGDSKRRMFENHGNTNSDAFLTSDDFSENPFTAIPNHLQKTSSHPTNPSSESVYFFQQKVPSSPPISLPNQIESSPTKEYDETTFFTSQATMIAHESDNDSEDTIDFNINNLNKVHGYISSDYVQEDFYNGSSLDDEELNFKARAIIAEAIEDGNAQIRLDHMGLRNLPDDVEDLKNMVTIGSNGIEIPKLEIYASHNKLRVLPPNLFDVKNVMVLSLRHNRMKKLTGKISKLTQLTDLSIASNEIKVIPYQILKLTKLSNFLIRPNPYLWELKDQDDDFAVQVAEENESQEVFTRRYVSRLKWSDLPVQTSSQIPGKAVTNDREMMETVSPVPKLSELTLRVISRYKVSLSETRMWKKNIPNYLQKMIAKAIQKGAYEETCSVCEKVTVNPVAKSLEWWDIKSQKLVPLVRKFCCGNCVKSWLDEVDDAVEKFQRANSSDSEDKIVSDASRDGEGDIRVETGDQGASELRFDENF